jgi:hypothetical protein
LASTQVYRNLLALLSASAFLFNGLPGSSLVFGSSHPACDSSQTSSCCADSACCCSVVNAEATSQENEAASGSCCHSHRPDSTDHRTEDQVNDQQRLPSVPPSCPCCPNGCCGCCPANTAYFPCTSICFTGPAPCVGSTCSEDSILLPPAPLSEVLQPPRV